MWTTRITIDEGVSVKIGADIEVHLKRDSTGRGVHLGIKAPVNVKIKKLSATEQGRKLPLPVMR